MVMGLLLIAFGVMVAAMPQILVAIISTFFIVTGLGMCVASWQCRRLRRSSDLPLVNWVVRF